MTEKLDDLGFRFFKLFAQYEYALKAIGYVRPGRDGQAEVHWDRFSNELGSGILATDDHAAAEAIDYLFSLPPKRQALLEGEVMWAEVSGAEKTPQALFAHIRRVRNNFYHGGKFNGRWLEPERTGELLEKCMSILLEQLRTCPPLAEAIQSSTASESESGSPPSEE